MSETIKSYPDQEGQWLYRATNKDKWQGPQYFEAKFLNDAFFHKWKNWQFKKVEEKITWEKYALKIAHVAAERSEDPYIKVGACILRHDHSVAGTGYNGPPRGVDIDWSNRDERRRRIVHAEVNALTYCKKGEVYMAATTIAPCASCVSVLAAYGIKKVVFSEIYGTDPTGPELMKEFGIEYKQIKIDNAPNLLYNKV